MFLRGELPDVALTEAELDRILGTLYATVEQMLPGPAPHRLRQPPRRLTRSASTHLAAHRVVSGRIAVGEVGSSIGSARTSSGDSASQLHAGLAFRTMALELVVIGGGNMGAALLMGMLSSGEFDADGRRDRRAARRSAGDPHRPVPRRARVRRDPRLRRRRARREATSTFPRSPATRPPPAPGGCCRSPPA